ncbi:MAG: universal stress protein [Desulfobacteraceae bacterium]|jgi:nucleotide-binding universal stress UspA family protein|nr:universal stress protein [Desulfobacteraceae bacterium]
MKILFATAGPASAHENADYVVNIAKRLGAELTVLHVLSEEDDQATGNEALKFFLERGEKAHVQVTGILQTGEIISQIINLAEKESSVMIIMGASRGMLLNEWLSSYVKQKTTVPVLVIPIGGPQKNHA